MYRLNWIAFGFCSAMALCVFLMGNIPLTILNIAFALFNLAVALNCE